MTARIIGPQECDQRRYPPPPIARPNRMNGYLATALIWLSIGWMIGLLCGVGL